MPRNLFTSVLLFLGLGAGPAPARDLQVEVEVLHIGGLLAPAELEALLADERLNIVATYEPTRLIEGVTARRERTLPLGSRLHAILHQLSLKGAQVERKGRSLRFTVAEPHPEHANYRLLAVNLRTPMAPGLGRPQPDFTMDLVNPVPRSGAEENALYGRFGAFDLGVRVRHRWSDAQGAARANLKYCLTDILSRGDGQYYFRPQHRFAPLMKVQAPGQRSFRLREPFPEPLTGWKLSNDSLLQSQVDGQTVERLSLNAEQSGPGHCRRSRTYQALFAGGQLIEVQYSAYDTECAGEDSRSSRSVEAGWADDGSLARYQAGSPSGTRTWLAVPAALAAQCDLQATPPASEEVQALTAELQRIRAAFLRP